MAKVLLRLDIHWNKGWGRIYYSLTTDKLTVCLTDSGTDWFCWFNIELAIWLNKRLIY